MILVARTRFVVLLAALAALVAGVLVGLVSPAWAGGVGVSHGADGSRSVLYGPARLEIEASSDGRCVSAFRVDGLGTRLPAPGVKFLLDDRRVFSVSGRVCTDRAWTTAQAVWRNEVRSRVLVNARAAGPVLVVGHLTALTGQLSYFGESQSRAAALAADHLNLAGGVAGASVVVVDRDTAVDPLQGVKATSELLWQDGAAAILGAAASGVTVAVAEGVTEPAGVLQVSGSSTAPSITTLDDNDFLFRTALSDAAQGVVLADLAVELGYETAGVLYIDNAYGRGLTDRFVEAFTARGGEVTATAAHGDDQPSYVAELEEATAGDPDVLVVVSYQQAEVYLQEALREGYADTFLFTDATKSAELLEAVGWDLLEGSYGTGPGVEASRPQTRAFVDAYTAVYGEQPPQPFMNETYDAAVLVGLAAAAAGTVTDSTAIRDQLRHVANPPGVVVGPGAAGVKRALGLIAAGVDVNYEGASGPVDLDANGDVRSGTVEIWRVEDGRIVPVRQTPVELSGIVDVLRENAAAFEYEIGQHGGSLRVATISEPLTFNLAISNDAGSSDVLGYLFEGLTEVSWLTDRVEPGLAKRWERSDDGLTWTFHLRRDVRWHDGQPFTAGDVDFTFNRVIYNDEIPASARASFTFRYPDEETGGWQEAPMTVEALDDYTVRFVLPVPFAPFLRSMGTAIYPEHILGPYVEDGTFAEVWGIDTDPAEIVGTGPFTIGLYEPGERLVLRRNPGYWLKDAAGNRLPYLDRIVHEIVPDLETELARFQAGKADLHGVSGREYALLEPLQGEGDFTIHRRGPAFGTTFLAFNMNPGSSPETGEPHVTPEKLGWFQNTRFRQAVAHAIDKDTIIREILDGLGYPQWASISPAAGDFHNPGVRRYEYDVGKANGILDSLGWTDTDGDGIREDSEGNRIEFTLVTNTGNTVREQVTLHISEGLEKIGVKANYRLVEFGELVAQLTASYDWEAMVIGFTGSPDPYGGIIFWHSSESLHLWNPNQAQPATDWEARIDDLYIQASQELDHQKRVELYHQAQQIDAENVPVIYTTLSERLTAIRNVFGNTTPTLYGIWDTRYLYRTDQ